MTAIQTSARLIVSIFFLGQFLSHIFSDEHYEYIASSHENSIQYSIGFIYLLFFLSTLLPFHWIKKIPIFVWICCALVLFANTFGAFIHSKFVPEQIIEHALKIGMPLWFFAAIHEKPILTNLTKALLALTYIGHGVFALGLNYVPDNFINMTVTILNLNQESAVNFLFIIGLIDILAAVAIYFSPFRKPALVYMIIWGSITALARAFYAFETAESFEGILSGIANTIYRLPNGVLPFIVFIMYAQNNSINSSKTAQSSN